MYRDREEEAGIRQRDSRAAARSVAVACCCRVGGAGAGTKKTGEVFTSDQAAVDTVL